MFWQKKRHKSLLETVSLTSTTWKTVKKINIKHKSSDLPSSPYNESIYRGGLASKTFF